MKNLLLAILTLTVIPLLPCARAGEDSWDNLRILRVGEKIQVVDQKLKSFTGTFVGVAEEAISFQVGRDPVTVQRPDVLRVTSRERTRRGRNALIGLGIGAAAGVAGMVIALEKSTTGPVYYDGEGAAWLAAGAVWGGGVGAGVGAAFPSHPTIYRSERRKDQSKP